jgi:uncharacterized protein YukE
MTQQTVNTDGIETTANKLNKMNADMTFIFGYLKSTAKGFDNDWRGSAGESARTLMYQIFKKNEEREKVLQSYVDLLRKKVNPDYITTEADNRKLADEFK